jgi:hypothetical protein
MLAKAGAAFVEIDQTNLQQPNECGPCLLLTTSSQVCGPFERAPSEQERRTSLAVALFSADVNAVLGKMTATGFDFHLQELKQQLACEDTTDRSIICNRLPLSDAARFKRLSSSTVCAIDLRKLMKCGSMITGSSLSLALPCLA